MKISFRGEPWTLKFSRLRRYWGWCIYRDRIIKIAKGLAEADELNTVIHEATHAFFPDLREEVVEQFGDDVANVLIRLGWRKS